MDSQSTTGRRRFLEAAGGALLLQPRTVFGSQANSTVEVGLLGCGSRGNWIAPFFPEHAGARVVAVADVIRSRLDSTREKLHVDAGRAYWGPEAYRELAQSSLDAVVIETPPYYHPAHAAAAVDAGKHVYCAKPVAVDVPDCRSFLASGQKARSKGLSFWVDFQTRARPVFQEVVERIQRGDIGKVAMAQVFYYANRPWVDRSTPGMDPGLKRMVNWIGDRVISGDVIVEQNIHVLDMANWYLGGHPLKATGAGGRTSWAGTRSDTGDAWDHFAVTYWYPDNVHATFSSHQLTGRFSDLCVRCFGLKGCADTHYGGLVRVASDDADKTWNGAEKDDTFTAGCIANVREFIQSVQSAKPINNAPTAVESNLTGILGRMAAYRGGVVSWDEMMASHEKWEANLKLQW
ncbi:MAG TPA: Gfo/Idh/MocA family oxidoreductase [Bryobacteraceae bacterium]|nr:Gfo/Idh/MocA family oxidoreductase [Bryobacteraceae bacterium]